MKVIVTIKDNDSHLGAFGQSTSPTLLATFVSNIANFVNSNGYDGVDFDWEQQINSSQYESLLSSMRATFGTSKLILTDMGNWNNMPAVAAASYSDIDQRSEEHTSELQSPLHLVCRLLLEKKNDL